MTLLPFAVLAWAFVGRGASGRGRLQVMMLTSALYTFYWWGGTGLLILVCGTCVIQYLGTRRHVLPHTVLYQFGDIDLRDFRGGQRVAELAEHLGFVHFADFYREIGTARFEYKSFTDGTGTFLNFSRTKLMKTHGDSLWMESYYPNGETLSSSDEVRHIDFPVPFRQMNMKILSTLPELYAFHSASARTHSSVPLILDPTAFLERVRRDEENRLKFGFDSGYLTKHGTSYRYSWRSTARVLLASINPARPLASQLTVGQLDASLLRDAA